MTDGLTTTRDTATDAAADSRRRHRHCPTFLVRPRWIFRTMPSTNKRSDSVRRAESPVSETTRRHLLTLTGGATIASLAGCLGDATGDQFSAGTDAESDWPMPRYNTTNSAFAANAAGPRSGATVRWTIDGGLTTGPPVVADQTVFLPEAEALRALDTTDGTELWRFTTDDGPAPSPASVSDGVVYATMRDQYRMHAIDVETGESLWQTPDEFDILSRPHVVAGPDFDDPVVFVGTEDGQVVRLDPADGTITARIDLFGGVTTFALGSHTLSDALYVGTRGGELYALYDALSDDGLTEAWRQKVGSVVREVVPDEAGLFVNTFADPLIFLRNGAHAGRLEWTIEKQRANTAPATLGNTVAAGGYEELAVFPDSKGDPRWTADGDFDAVAPVAAGDTLYASTGDRVFAFALGGGTGPLGGRSASERWSIESPVTADQGLAVADGGLFVASKGTEEDTVLTCLEEP